jgi:hypothetical protein
LVTLNVFCREPVGIAAAAFPAEVDLAARNGSLEALGDLVSDEFKVDHK